MLLELLSYIPIIPAAVLCYAPMKNQRRYSVGRIAILFSIIFLLTTPAVSFLAVRFNLGPNTLFFPVLFLYFIMYHYSLKVHISKSLAFFLLIFAFQALLSNISNGYDAVKNPGLGADILTADFVRMQLLLCFVSTMLLFIPLRRYGGVLADHLDVPVAWYSTMPISVIFCILSLGLRPVKYETLYFNRVFRAFWIVNGMTLFLIILLSIMFYFIVRGMLKTAEAVERNQMLEMQEMQFVAQQRYMAETERQRHDFRHSMRTLAELYDSGDIHAMSVYLHEYIEEMPKKGVQTFCGNAALNAVLNYYANLAKQNRIEYSVRIDLPDTIRVSDVDLCSAVSNILENAMDACCKVDKGFIKLIIHTEEDSQLYIVAVNSFDGRVRQDGSMYRSTKRKGSGIGLSSIDTIAKKYGGDVQFSHKDNEFYSNVVIPLE